MHEPEEYAVGVVGGATAGAEAAAIFADQGFLTVVFEQNDRPYGKIEDGLPRWHAALRRKEYESIDSKLDQPRVHFVPRTRLGRDLDLRDLSAEWGLHAVVLANGAWRDRPLPIDGADAWVGKGLVYQNPFIYWFNHYREGGYAGPSFEILDDTVVVGGGLASIDVAKVLQLEAATRALAERGIEQDLIEMEVKGIPATLAAHGLEWDDLGLQGCRLCYRRRPDDMPLVELPANAAPKTALKVMKSRRRILEKARDKYLFRFEPLRAPAATIVEDDRLVGLVFAVTSMESGRLETTDERVEVRGAQFISSIGSIPEAIDGIPLRGELYAFDDWDTGRMDPYPNLFSVGNVVTGKGNIVASRKHSRWVSQHMLEHYFRIAEDVKRMDPLPAGQRDAILERVRGLQQRAGYDGRYREWIDAVTSPRLGIVPNRLTDETSLYLRQHRDNPVDWYPWGEEAWGRARREDRPVLVSIGYSSCHWCHVMERESFEDPAIAALMNDALVCIKVDREERPDVDQVYMETVVRLTGSGGWPLNVFCSADGRPFYGGTYFPPARAHGRPSWREVVESVAQVWAGRRGEIETQASQILEALSARPDPGERPAGDEVLRALGQQLMAQADRSLGGFGGAPKFPTPTNLEALLLACERGVAPADARGHVVFTLERMARGGIYDQLGGGFHRYSTDARWLVPHFEKMLYDQGQLLRVYAEAYRQTAGVDPASDPADPANLEWPVAETIEFLEREMAGEAGGFLASLDADSEGEEGRFYVWTPGEIETVLGPEAGAELAAAYGVEPDGNFEQSGHSVLAHGLAGERPRFAAARRALLEARGGRTRPATDTKHVTAWIAYAVGGLATAGAAFDRPEWVARAARAADFLLDRMRDPGGRLLRIWDGQRARVGGFLDDHAATLCALLDLYRAGGEARHVEAALALGEVIRAHFFDPAAGDLRFVADDAEPLVVRPASDADGATPGAAGLAALGLARLAGLCGRADLGEVVDGVLAASALLLTRAPAHVPTLARAAALRDAGPGVALVLGPRGDPAGLALARRARELLGSEDLVVPLEPGERPAWLDPAWLEGRDARGDLPTAYLCRGSVCSIPATRPGDLELPPSGAG